jgi:hypothetical protein
MISAVLEASIAGSWVSKTGPNRRWEGVLRANSPYALLLVATLPSALKWAKSRSRGAAEMAIRFDVHGLGTENGAQLMLFAGDAWIQDVVVELPPAAGLPRFCAPPKLGAGLLHETFVADSRPSASFGMLLLPMSEVAVGRTGVWRLREPRTDLPADLVILANAGRAGTASRDS